MLIVTPEDFSANIKTYDQPVQIEENGNVIGQFFPKAMEKHPERYKTYKTPQELWDELGITRHR